MSRPTRVCVGATEMGRAQRGKGALQGAQRTCWLPPATVLPSAKE